MINPLLHPHSSSAPTSPRCTRQIRIRNRTTVVSTAGNVVMRAVPKKYREMSPSRRRLSRVVKCRTVDFTEFPEGMRDYGRIMRNKPLLREIHSQPGSPVIPRIEIYDFGSEVHTLHTRASVKESKGYPPPEKFSFEIPPFKKGTLWQNIHLFGQF